MIKKKRLLLHIKYAIKVSLFHHDTDRLKPVEIDDIMNTDVSATPLYMVSLYCTKKHLSIINLSICKYTDPIRLQRICKGKVTVVAILFLSLKYLALLQKSLLIENQFVLFLLRYAYTVIRTCHRCKVAYDQNIIAACRRFTDEAENASVTVIGIDPLKR